MQARECPIAALEPPQLHQSRQGNLPASLLLELICALVDSITLGPLSIDEIKTSGLSLTVDEGTSEPSKEFLGLVVACRLTFCTLSKYWCMIDGNGRTVLLYVILVGLGGLVGCGTGDQSAGPRYQRML
jgi:hypothetical protein